MPDVAASEVPEAYGRPHGSGFWTVAFALRIGRRGMMLAAVATMMLAMGVLAAWKDLPVPPGLRTVPETGAPAKPAVMRDQQAGSQRKVRLPIPAAAATMAAFSANGLFAGLPGLFLATTLGGLVLLVVSVRLSVPSLALFLLAGALIGAGSGAVFKGTRLRHPRRTGRRRFRLGAAGTPSLIPRPGPSATGMRNDMWFYFAPVRMQQATS